MNPGLHELLHSAEIAIAQPAINGYRGRVHVGVDLGSAYTSIFVLDKHYRPLIGAYQFAEIVRDGLTGPVAAMLAAGLSYPGKDRGGVKEAMEEEALNQMSQLKARLGYLDIIVTLAPLLGLLGTVTGMISSFSVLDVSSGKPFAITGGVAEALIATATGLAIAIVALLFYSYFTSRVDYYIFQMEKSATKFLNYLPWAGEK